MNSNKAGFMTAIPMSPPVSVNAAGYNPPPYSTQYTHHGANSSQGFMTAIPMSPPVSVNAAGYNPPPYSTQYTHHGANSNQSTLISLPEIIENPEIAGPVKNMEFNDKTLRHGFVKKVYSILMSQLLITGLTIFGFMNIPPSGTLFIAKNFWQVCAAPIILYFGTLFCILCCEGPRRRVPWNYMFLLLFTLSMSFIMGLLTRMFEAKVVLIAGGITFGIILGLTLFAFQTKYDFTLLTGSCLSIALALLMLGIAVLSKSYDQMKLVYLTLGVIIISIYIVWDTQMIIGGSHRYGFSAEEYVFAALVLYIDIMYLFIRILRYAILR